jgi:hypothetical protein
VSYRIDINEVRRGLELLAPPVFELRCLDAKVRGEYRPGTYSGYFDADHHDAAIEALEQIENASACYFTPNHVNPALLGRAYNRARIVKDRDPLTTDKDITERRWLLIDVDAVRPSHLSATPAEKAAAEGMVTAIDYWLWEKGFPPGIIGDSGNGCHLMIPVTLPADDKGFCKRMLAGLAKQFNTEAATVDVSVFNASRIWKLPGTLVCKGDNCPEIGREWRMSKILCVCADEQREWGTHAERS